MSQANILPFQFESHNVRVYIDEKGDPNWVATDVCEILGLSNTPKAVSRLESDEYFTITFKDDIGRPHQANLLTESGLYRLTFRSNKRESKRFQAWVFGEVLPALRKKTHIDYSLGSINDFLHSLEMKRDDPPSKYLYVIGNEFSNAVKIGVSNDPDARLESLQIGSPVRLRIMYAWSIIKPYIVEKKIHNILSSRRIHGEWFDLDYKGILDIYDYIYPYIVDSDCQAGDTGRRSHMPAVQD